MQPAAAGRGGREGRDTREGGSAGGRDKDIRGTKEARDGRKLDSRGKDDRIRDARGRNDRGKDDRGKDDRAKELRGKDDRGKEPRVKDDRGKERSPPGGDAGQALTRRSGGDAKEGRERRKPQGVESRSGRDASPAKSPKANPTAPAKRGAAAPIEKLTFPEELELDRQRSSRSARDDGLVGSRKASGGAEPLPR